MNYAAIKNNDIANGPGVRVSLFVSGCTHRCPGCFNSETWDFNYGKPFTQKTIDEIIAMLAPTHIKGITILGGEPFETENQPAVVELLRQVKKIYPQKSVWAFSGYLFDRDIMARRLGDWKITEELLRYLDVLVDGPFVQSKKDLTLRFRGSSNQRLIDVQASLSSDSIVLWEDWQGNGKGLKE